MWAFCWTTPTAEHSICLTKATPELWAKRGGHRGVRLFLSVWRVSIYADPACMHARLSVSDSACLRAERTSVQGTARAKVAAGRCGVVRRLRAQGSQASWPGAKLVGLDSGDGRAALPAWEGLWTASPPLPSSVVVPVLAGTCRGLSSPVASTFLSRFMWCCVSPVFGWRCPGPRPMCSSSRQEPVELWCARRFGPHLCVAWSRVVPARFALRCVASACFPFLPWLAGPGPCQRY